MRRVEEAVEGELAGGAAARADGGQALAGGRRRGLAHRRAVNLPRLNITTKYLFNNDVLKTSSRQVTLRGDHLATMPTSAETRAVHWTGGGGTS